MNKATRDAIENLRRVLMNKTGDEEGDHGCADRCVPVLLEALGETELADLWRKESENWWYA